MTTLYEYDGRLFYSKEEAIACADEKLRMVLGVGIGIEVKFVWSPECVLDMTLSKCTLVRHFRANYERAQVHRYHH